MPPAPRIPVIVGPTAGGKTALAVAAALEFARRGCGVGEVISADAYQIYRGMDIGTGKATAEERRGIEHHLIDILDPDVPEPFTVAQWLARAEAAIAEIRGRGHSPIIAGGTHLYIKAFLHGMFEGPGADDALREQLRAKGLPALREELARVDPAAAARIHPNDERRTVRALEVFRLTGVAMSEHQSQWDRQARPDAILIGLRWSPEEINLRINARVRQMIAAGLVDEVTRLLPCLRPQAREALGYKQLPAEILSQGAPAGSLEDATEQIKIETRRFAKNQRTWLRRLRSTPQAVWFEPASQGVVDMAQTIVQQSLKSIEPDPARGP